MFDRHHTCTKLATEVETSLMLFPFEGIKSSQSNNGHAMFSPTLKEQSAENKTGLMILFYFGFGSFVTLVIRRAETSPVKQQVVGSDVIDERWEAAGFWFMKTNAAPLQITNLWKRATSRSGLLWSLSKLILWFFLKFKWTPFKMSGAQLNWGSCMLNIGAEGFCQCAVKPRYFITSLLLCKEEMKKEKKNPQLQWKMGHCCYTPRLLEDSANS